MPKKSAPAAAKPADTKKSAPAPVNASNVVAAKDAKKDESKTTKASSPPRAPEQPKPAAKPTATAAASKPSSSSKPVAAKEVVVAAPAAASVEVIATPVNVPTAIVPLAEPLETRHGVEVQRIEIPHLIHALDRAHELGRTALVLDSYGTIATFFKYAKGVEQIDCKAFVVQMAKQEKTRDEILEQLRQECVKCLKNGISLVLNFGNAAPDFLQIFNDASRFPTSDLFDTTTIKTAWPAVFRDEEYSPTLRLMGPKFEALEDPSHSRILGFRVIVLSSFEFNDYEGAFSFCLIVLNCTS
jgi:hypothetical protein